MRYLCFFRLILLGVAVLILVFLFYLNLVPSGRYFVWSDFSGANPAVSVFYPESRVSRTPDGIIMREDPVYFDVRIPRKFDSAKLKIYFDDVKTDLLEAGVESSPGQKNFTFAPLWNDFLNNLDWPRMGLGNYILYQRRRDFADPAEFWRRWPAASTAVYRAPVNYSPKINNYIASRFAREINSNLVGPFKFYTYIKNEPLDFTFTFKASDEFEAVSLRVWFGDKMVVSREYFDLAGFKSDLKDTRTFHLYNASLPEGVYKIEVAAPPGITTKKIVSPARYISFMSPLRFAAGSDEINLLTSSRELYLKAYGQEPVSVLAGGASHELETPETRYDIKIQSVNYVLKPVWLSAGDVEIGGAGLFVFDWPSFFNPTLASLDADLVRAGFVDYILTTYHPPSEEGGVFIGEADFSLESVAPTPARKIRFALSVPHLSAGARGVRIKKVEIIFSGEKFSWNWLRMRFQNFIHGII